MQSQHLYKVDNEGYRLLTQTSHPVLLGEELCPQLEVWLNITTKEEEGRLRNIYLKEEEEGGGGGGWRNIYIKKKKQKKKEGGEEGGEGGG